MKNINFVIKLVDRHTRSFNSIKFTVKEVRRRTKRVNRNLQGKEAPLQDVETWNNSRIAGPFVAPAKTFT